MVMRRGIGLGLVGDLETAVGAVVGAAAALLHLGRVLLLGGMVQVEDWDHVVLCRHTRVSFGSLSQVAREEGMLTKE